MKSITHGMLKGLDNVVCLSFNNCQLPLDDMLLVQHGPHFWKTSLTLNILGWKSGSTAKSLRSWYVVSSHHTLDVRSGKKWSRVRFANSLLGWAKPWHLPGGSYRTLSLRDKTIQIRRRQSIAALQVRCTLTGSKTFLLRRAASSVSPKLTSALRLPSERLEDGCFERRWSSTCWSNARASGVKEGWSM